MQGTPFDADDWRERRLLVKAVSLVIKEFEGEVTGVHNLLSNGQGHKSQPQEISNTKQHSRYLVELDHTIVNTISPAPDECRLKYK